MRYNMGMIWAHVKTQGTQYKLVACLASGFLLTMSTALVTYINSTYVSSFVGEAWTGAIFSVAYLATFFVIPQYGRLIRVLSNAKVLFLNLVAQAASLLVLAWQPAVWSSVLAFIVFIITISTTIINYDLYLEALVPTELTGRLRGIFWTVLNLGFLVSPFLTGQVVERLGMPSMYLFSALLIIPAFLLMFSAFWRQQDMLSYRKHEPWVQTLVRLSKNRDIRGIFLIAFVLYFFYAWMVIYTPLYLQQAGFDWGEIGVMFTIMLIPFVVVEYPAGYLADKYLGETELLTLGLALMAFSVLGLMSATSFFSMTLALFCSRLGASLVEIMRESYFYKKVSGEDVDLIDAFRNVASFAHIVAPVLATLIITLGHDIQVLFFTLTLILALSTGLPVTMKDTK